jgi:hypothetical protein
MSSVEQAYETQLKNIQTRTGKTLEELGKIVQESGLTKHGEIREMLKRELGMGHGDANALVHYLFQSDGERAAKAAGSTTNEVLNEIYTGAKVNLRPIHDKLMDRINQFGEFEIAPKKGYVSLRRKKQFAMIGPATKTQVELGLNVKALPAAGRMKEMPKGSMCNYTIRLADAAEVDEELITWIREAYDSAG